jgi:hypothetical protein
MQTTISSSEAADDFIAVIERSQSAPVLIRDGDEDVAVVFSLRPRVKTEAERQAAWEKFERTRNRLAAELEANLAREGTTVEDFLADVLES